MSYEKYSRNLLGALIYTPDSYWEVGDFVKPEFFENQWDREIWQVISKLSSQGIRYDMLILKDKLSRDAVMRMIDIESAPASNVVQHSRLLAQHYMKHKLELHAKAIQRGLDLQSDPILMLDKAEAHLSDCRSILVPSKTFDTADNVISTIREYEKRVDIRKSGRLVGINTGFEQLNEMTGGWRESDLIIVGGRPGMGKTSLGLKFAAYSGVPAVFFSLEMPAQQLMDRYMSMETGIALSRIRDGRLSQHDFMVINNKANALLSRKMVVDDTVALSINEFNVLATRYVNVHKVGLIIVDYLQLMTGTKHKREEEVAEISRGLKAVAKRLKIPIIAMAQMNRSAEQTGNKKPALSDLRESGAIEQDADIVLFPFRPEYYGISQFEDGSSTTGMAELIIAKHRNGPTGEFQLKFDGPTTNFMDIDEYDDTPSIFTHPVAQDVPDTSFPF